MVRVCVDTDICIGAGQCELIEPSVFYLNDDDGMARVRADASLSRDRAERVVSECPSGALRIQD